MAYGSDRRDSSYKTCGQGYCRVDMSSGHGEEDGGEGDDGKTSNHATVDLGTRLGQVGGAGDGHGDAGDQ